MEDELCQDPRWEFVFIHKLSRVGDMHYLLYLYCFGDRILRVVFIDFCIWFGKTRPGSVIVTCDGAIRYEIRRAHCIDKNYSLFT